MPDGTESSDVPSPSILGPGGGAGGMDGVSARSSQSRPAPETRDAATLTADVRAESSGGDATEAVEASRSSELDEAAEHTRVLEANDDGVVYAAHRNADVTVLGAYEDGEVTLARRVAKVELRPTDARGESTARLTVRDGPQAEQAEGRLAELTEATARDSSASRLTLEVSPPGDSSTEIAQARWRGRGYDVTVAEDGRSFEASRDLPDPSLREIPSEKEGDFFHDAGEGVADVMPAAQWREASVEERREKVEQAWSQLGETRLQGAVDGRDTPLLIRDTHRLVTEGYRPGGGPWVLLDEVRLRDDDPSGIVAELAKARQYDYQARRIEGGLAAVESPAESLEDGGWDRASPDWTVDSREPWEVDDPFAYDFNRKVSDARAASANVSRQYWRSQWESGAELAAAEGGLVESTESGVVEPAFDALRVRGNDARFDVPMEDASAYRRAARELAASIPPERWRDAGLEERCSLAREAHVVVREAYGLPQTELRIDGDMADGSLGAFDRENGSLAVNEQLLAANDPDALFGVLLHENRHNVQHEDIETHGGSSRWFVADARYPMEINQAVPSPKVVEDYSYNYLELDARAAEGVGMDEYWRASVRRSLGVRRISGD